MLTLLGLLLVGHASAHRAYHADLAIHSSAAAVVDSRQTVANDAFRSVPGCPGHGGGECCCDQVFAHSPPQPQTHAIAPTALSLPIAPVVPSVGVRASRIPPVPFACIVTGSRGLRGPPSA
jgi:hypothetical protein